MATLTSWSTWTASMSMRKRWNTKIQNTKIQEDPKKIYNVDVEYEYEVEYGFFLLKTVVLKVKQWRDEGEIQNECDGPCYKVMLKVVEDAKKCQIHPNMPKYVKNTPKYVKNIQICPNTPKYIEYAQKMTCAQSRVK